MQSGGSTRFRDKHLALAVDDDSAESGEKAQTLRFGGSQYHAYEFTFHSHQSSMAYKELDHEWGDSSTETHKSISASRELKYICNSEGVPEKTVVKSEPVLDRNQDNTRRELGKRPVTPEPPEREELENPLTPRGILAQISMMGDLSFDRPAAENEENVVNLLMKPLDYFDKQTSGKDGWVYAIRDPELDLVKIGRTLDDPASRLHKINQSCRLSEAAHVIDDPQRVPLKAFKRLEALVHKDLMPHRWYWLCECGKGQHYLEHREWYDVTPDVAIRTIRIWRDLLLQDPYGILEENTSNPLREEWFVRIRKRPLVPDHEMHDHHDRRINRWIQLFLPQDCKTQVADIQSVPLPLIHTTTKGKQREMMSDGLVSIGKDPSVETESPPLPDMSNVPVYSSIERESPSLKSELPAASAAEESLDEEIGSTRSPQSEVESDNTMAVDAPSKLTQATSMESHSMDTQSDNTYQEHGEDNLEDRGDEERDGQGSEHLDSLQLGRRLEDVSRDLIADLRSGRVSHSDANAIFEAATTKLRLRLEKEEITAEAKACGIDGNTQSIQKPELVKPALSYPRGRKSTPRAFSQATLPHTWWASHKRASTPLDDQQTSSRPVQAGQNVLESSISSDHTNAPRNTHRLKPSQSFAGNLNGKEESPVPGNDPLVSDLRLANMLQTVDNWLRLERTGLQNRTAYHDLFRFRWTLSCIAILAVLAPYSPPALNALFWSILLPCSLAELREW
ncbi:hypothetical protein LTR37_013616 [Vermiconidia calcicola]|uniref:Uncharacterized protein n=1 Tax=Vermiconidia calcicola TaxID=1690605 RepID=A0ACC3MVV2_9PEZI|nr:hypothetical protein LTR37_013616 [Vermiconidia calcicola]